MAAPRPANKAAAPEVYTLVDKDGREYRTSSKAEAENRIRTQGFRYKKRRPQADTSN